MKRILSLLLIYVLLASAIPAVASITVGLPADPTPAGSQFPFGGAYTGEYQQVYRATQFSGPITITNLEFFNTRVDSSATAMNSGNWAISLSTTSANWNTLSTVYASNIGANNTLVFNGDLSQPWAFGDTLHIALSTPFTYDPSQGNLLMDVFATDTSDANGTIYFDINGSNDFMGRVTGAARSGYGLVTGFSTSTPVPEPATMLFLGLSLVGLAGMRSIFKM